MIVALLVYLFVGGVCVGWWSRVNGPLWEEDGMLAVGVLLWPAGVGLEIAYRIGQFAGWVRDRLFTGEDE